jgi:hypothetical protein
MKESKMPLLPRFWTIGALAVELGRDPRTIASALKHTPPEGKDGRHRAWLMTTAMTALEPVARRPRPSSRGEESAIDAAEATWEDLRRGFERLEAEKDVNARRVMARDTVGPLVKELEASLNAVWRSDQDRLIFSPLRDKLIAVAISTLVELCQLEMKDTPTGLALVVP